MSPAVLLKNRACMVAMVEREGDVSRETVRELWSTTVGRSREFAHLAGVLFELNKSDIQTSYTEDARNSTPTSCNDAPKGGLAHPFLLLASPAWSQRAGGPPGRYGGENQPFVRFQEPH